MSKQTESSDSKKALLDAFDRVLQTQAEARAEQLAAVRRPTTTRRSVVAWVGLVGLLVLSAYVWVERPTWMFPPPPPPESAAVKEASLRITLANTARHIEHFRQKTGRLPATLEETGTITRGIVYERGEAGTYVLRGVNGPVQLSLRSTESLPAFVGNSFQIIMRRPR